jgi:hypothetical protein
MQTIMKTQLLVCAVLLVAAAQGLATEYNPGRDSGDLLALTADRTWHLQWAGCMGGNAGCRTYWDWGADGTVCARMVGAERGDRCADEGEWRIEAGNLCWQLTWLGGGEGYKSVCVAMTRTGNGRYEATRVGGFGVTFFGFEVPHD